MATRLRVKKTKMKKDRATEHKKNPQKRAHKVDQWNRQNIQAAKINRAR